MSEWPTPIDPRRVGLLLEFEVYGDPAAKGSKRAVPIYRGPRGAKVFTGKAVVVEHRGEKLETWDGRVISAAQAVLGERLLPAFHGPMRVEISFTVARRKSHFLPANSRRPYPTLRDDAPRWPVTRTGDLDKFERAVLDALTAAGVWPDDSFVVRLQCEKTYPGISRDALPVPGALIRIWEQR